ncbi:MAG: DUF222 domain-containing protein [Nocardioidaceae bacterium]|nr:DUF222 domain-containing protein [Nocardioidaceae bacterium]
MFEAVLDALAEATGCDRATLSAVVGVAPAADELTPAELMERIGAQERLASAAQAVQARDLAAFGAARLAQDRVEGVPEHLLGRTAVIEVGLRLRVAPATACGRLADATRAVADHPQLLALVGTGRVSMSGLRRVTSVTEILTPSQRRLVDSELAQDALRAALSPGQLERAAHRRVLAVDPGAAARRAVVARRDRRGVRLGDPVDGVAGVYATLRAEEALAVFGSLDRTARGMRRDGDGRSIDALLADLFVERVTGARLVPTAGPPPSWTSVDGWEPWTWSNPPPWPPLDADPGPADRAWDDWSRSAGAGEVVSAHRAPERRLPLHLEVQVVISAATLLGIDDAPGLLRGYGAVSADVIREIVDDADASGGRTVLRGLFCDPADGRLLAMDSTARLFSGGLRQFALNRDQLCRLSGGRIVDVDHVHEHQDGGPTSAANGQSLGKLAHVVKDHPGITVRTTNGLAGLDRLRAHSPDIVWTMPTGHTYVRPPPPVLGEGSQPVDASLGERHLRSLFALAG